VKGIVYVGWVDDLKVYALNASTGVYIWNYSTGGNIYSSPTVFGVVYIGICCLCHDLSKDFGNETITLPLVPLYENTWNTIEVYFIAYIITQISCVTGGKSNDLQEE
jgi:hypothetical protein